MADAATDSGQRLAALSGGRARPLPPAGDGRARVLLDVTGLSEHDAAALEARLQAALGGAPLIL
ncbi:MAG: hypothetical protein ACK40H_07990, partial [Sphingomonadaceae bacterium]